MLPPALPALILLQAQPTFYAAWEDGWDAERRGQFAQALAAYQRATELRPRSAARVIIYGNNLLQGYYPYTRLARCRLELGLREAAEEALAQAEHEGEPAEERAALQARLKASHPPKEVAPAPAAPRAPLPAAPERPAPPEPTPAPLPEHPQRPAVIAPGPPTRPERTPAAAPAAVAAPLAPTPSRAQPLTAPAPAAAVPGAAAPPAAGVHGLYWGLAGLALATLAAFGVRRREKRADQSAREPSRVGPYQLERLLGRGGFASTYLARKDGSQAPVALKLLHAFRQDDPEFLARFRQEARLGALLDHPHIVRLLDQGPEEDSPWLVMEFVEGRRLDQLLKDPGLLPLPLALDLARQVASATAYAHAKGVIHRDLKPANVMIVGTQAKVMDFGIARIIDAETLTTTYAFLGTPLYAAPELQLKTSVTPAADWYAFGIMLFQMIAGHAPFQGETPFEIMDLHRRAELPDLGAARPEAAPALVDLVRRLTLKDPAQRPGDAEVLALLEGLG